MSSQPMWIHWRNPKRRHAPGEVARRVQFADAALAVAGHEVNDPALQELTRRVAAGEIATEDSIREGAALIDAR